MVTLSFTIFSGQKNYNRAHMLFQVLCGFEPIFYTTHPNEEPINGKDIFGFYIEKNTDLTPIVEKITLAIENYGLPYFESCNSYEKFERQLYSGNEHIIYNLIFKFEWNILALSILLNEHTTKEIIEKYHDKFFEEESEFTEFNKRLSDQNKIIEVIK